MSNPLMRTVASALLSLSVLVLSSAPAQEKKEEKLETALKNGSWKMVIDLAPRFGGKVNPTFHDRSGKGTFKLADGKLTGEYEYTPGLGNKVTATLEGEVSKDEKTIKVKFVEKGLLPSKGFGEFTVVRKEGKVIALEGYWKLQDIDPKLKWHFTRETAKPKELKKSVKQALQASIWIAKAEVSAETLLKAAGNDAKRKKAVEDFIGKKKWIAFPKNGSVEFKTKDGKFIMVHTQPPQGPQERLVSELKTDGKLKVEFKAQHPNELARILNEDTSWKLEFSEKDGKIVGATGMLKNSKLEAKITLSPKDSK